MASGVRYRDDGHGLGSRPRLILRADRSLAVFLGIV